MTVISGSRLGPYEILAPIGSGGMGEVFKARDTRLERIVAIKILPEELSSDDRRRSRLQREARIISQLNHPNICTLHDAGSEGGVDFLVMEHLEGHSLADRLTKGPLPLEEVLRIGIEIAGALHRAHEQHIIHRDLKPSNIMLTKSGVKLLDFGLARFADASEASVTADGALVGTPRYMAPEQIDGRPSDQRADIFALGCVLYEMRSGKPAVGGVQRVAPPALDHVIAKCLETDPDQRWQSARDICEELRWVGQTGRRKRWKWIVPLTLVGLIVVALGGWFTSAPPVHSEVQPFRAKFTRLTVGPGTQQEFPAISPDGKFLAYTAGPDPNWDIYLQRIGGDKAINLTPDSKLDDEMAAFSPDGQRIAFRSGRDGGGIFVMGATGESVRRVSDFGFNPAWSPDGNELAVTSQMGNPYTTTSNGELWRIDVASGRKQRVYLGPVVNATWSPHGTRIAFCMADRGDIVSIPAAGGAATPITTGTPRDCEPVWSADGYIYFSSDRGGTVNLWRIAVDEATGRTRGELEPVATPSLWSGPLSISRDGKRIVYCSVNFDSTFARVSFDATTERVTGSAAEIASTWYIEKADVSADGQWVAFSTAFGPTNIYIVRNDGTGMRKLTDDDWRNASPRWSPDGKRVAFMSNRSGTTQRPDSRSQIWAINADGSQLQQLTDLDGAAHPVWSPDGRRIAVMSESCQAGACMIDLSAPLPAKTADLIRLPPLKPGTQRRLQAWSPDGKWLLGKTWGLNDTKDRTLFVYSVETGSYQELKQSFVAITAQVSWLSDSRRILLADGGTLYVIDRESPKKREIYAFPFFVPGLAVSRDDRTLYFLRRTFKSNIWLAELQ